MARTGAVRTFGCRVHSIGALLRLRSRFEVLELPNDRAVTLV